MKMMLTSQKLGTIQKENLLEGLLEEEPYSEIHKDL